MDAKQHRCIACPRCKHPLDLSDPASIRCPQCGNAYDVRNGIPHLVDTSSLTTPEAQEEFKNNLAWFERHHSGQTEPWRYSERAAEILKRQHIFEEVQTHSPEADTVLDIGCSMGQLSRFLARSTRNYYAIDISPTAVQKAVAWWSQADENARPTFLVASATALPFQPKSVDVIICMDGLHGMDMTEELQKIVLGECYTVLRSGGTIIFTDYMRPERFHEMENRIRQSPFRVVTVHYLHDRLWYQVESWFQLIGEMTWVRTLFRSTLVARALRFLSQLFGKYGSRHICIVAKKDGGSGRSTVGAD